MTKKTIDEETSSCFIEQVNNENDKINIIKLGK